MRPVSDFFPRVLPYALGCPEPTLAQAIVDAAIAFCEDSMVLREPLDLIQTEAGVDHYDLDAPPQQAVARVMDVYRDGVRLKSVLEDANRGTRTDRQSQPDSYRTTRAGSVFQLVLMPVPDRAYTVQVEAAMRPARGATQLEDDLLDRWVEAVSAGAISRLTAMPGQPYTSMETAAAYHAKAIWLANKARIEGSVGRMRGTQTVTPRPFVRGNP